MYLVISGAIGYFYHTQKPLTHTLPKIVHLSNAFHKDTKHWRYLLYKMASRPTYLVEIVQRTPANLVFIDASGEGAGGLYLNPNRDSSIYVWRILWPEYIASALVSFENPMGAIINSDLELVSLVLYEATFPLVCLSSPWRSLVTGRNNTPTVA